MARVRSPAVLAVGEQAIGDTPVDRVHARVSAIQLESETESVSVARRWLRDLLDGGGVHPSCIDIAILIGSELVSNAIRHGGGRVICHAVLDRDACTLSVFDFGDGEPAVVDRSVDTIGGLGLVIVERLAREWGVAAFGSGKAVFAVLDADRAESDRRSGDAVA